MIALALKDKIDLSSLLKLSLLGCAALAAILAVNAWLKSPSTLPIQQVRLEGDFRQISQVDVAKLLANDVNSGFFAVDKAGLINKINTLPWVKQTHVRTVWPDTLVITITERQAYAFWNDRSLMTREGVVFTPEVLPSLDIPMLKGHAESRELVLDQLKKMNELLKNEQPKAVYLRLAKHGSWDAILSNGIKVWVGHQEPAKITAKGVLALASLNEEIMASVESIDLRYPNGISVKWKGKQSPDLRAAKQKKPIKG